jgi:putative transposase
VYLRFDHGPEFIAYAVADWCRFNGAEHGLHRPGLAVAERLDRVLQRSRARRVLLNGQLFETLFEAQVLIEDWRIDYNMNRPHRAHRGLTPAEFAEAWTINRQLQLA